MITANLKPPIAFAGSRATTRVAPIKIACGLGISLSPHFSKNVDRDRAMPKFRHH
jgi:hypothetical protein